MLWIAYRQNCSLWNERVLVISFAETKDPPDCKRTRTYSSWYRRYSPRVWMEFLLSVPRNKRLCVEQSKVYQCTNTCDFECLYVQFLKHWRLYIHVFDCACKCIPVSPRYTCIFCILAWLYIHVCDCACQMIFLRYASNLMDICIEYGI